MMKKLRALAISLLFALALCSLARSSAAQTTGPMPKDITFEAKLGGHIPLDASLVDDDGRPKRLGDLLADGRPAILVLAYYECPMLCSMVLNGVTAAMRKNGLAAGDDFNLIVISIDPADTPERARAKKASYVRYYDRPGAERAFHFMTGPEAEVRPIADAIGFRYVYDPIGKQFAHPAGIVVLTPSGVISKYFYGIDFSPRDLRLGLVEAGAGAVGTATDKLMLLCFRYDPERGRYGTLAMGSIRAGGAATIVLLAISLVIMSRRARRAQRSDGDQYDRRA